MKILINELRNDIKNYENLTEEQKDIVYDKLHFMTIENKWGMIRVGLVKLYFKKLFEIAKGE